MNIKETIKKKVAEAIKNYYNKAIEQENIQVQKTLDEFEGDLTVVVFPFLQFSKKSPEQTGKEIGQYLKENIEHVANFNVIKGFLNLIIDSSYWLSFLNQAYSIKNYGFCSISPYAKTIMIEYSSPNTNKPLHLGHIRNNLLGYSLAEIIKANGDKVIKVNLVNDRGIHICKSMIAWKKWGTGETPENTGKKGDRLVGDYYVKFDKEYKKQILELKNKGFTEDEAISKAPLILEAQEMLRKWEAKDKETIDLWTKMNNWVYKGFDETYKKLGVDFDKIYYESETYQSGKTIVSEGLEKGVLFKKGDNSVWADLTKDGLDEKLLLRSDGTSVYITQDIGTAYQRFNEFTIDKLIYVVGNEQNYHFQVLSIVLDKLGYSWAKDLYHLSYGMVELPSGKMKSREGTVVDADDLIDEMIKTAQETSKDLGKLDNCSEQEIEKIINIIALGALKYFILKIEPKKNMLFDPEKSIDFNGNTGPFIQYTYARIQSVLRKAKEQNILISPFLPTESGQAPRRGVIDASLSQCKKEIQLIKLVYEYPEIIKEAGESLSPAIIANYVYELAKEYNQFYHDFAILKAENKELRDFRLVLSTVIAQIIKSSMSLLGIEVPERM